MVDLAAQWMELRRILPSSREARPVLGVFCVYYCVIGFNKGMGIYLVIPPRAWKGVWFDSRTSDSSGILCYGLNGLTYKLHVSYKTFACANKFDRHVNQRTNM